MAKRRPGRDPEMDHGKHQTEAHHQKTHKHETHHSSTSEVKQEAKPEVEVVEVEKEVSMNQNTEATHSKPETQEQHQETLHRESSTGEASSKVEINFKGSEILRAKFPKTFETAEKIATDWVHDGRFEGIDLGHPLAQYFAAKSLRKAKEIEKKVLESPITEKVAMNALTAGMKAQEIINQVRSKLKK